MSSFLFNLVVDALSAILDAAKRAGHLRGVMPHLIAGGGVTHLQYADDTILMVEGTSLDIINLKFLLLCSQEMSGLAINVSKSEVLVMGYTNQERAGIANVLNYRLGLFPISYLGLPVSDSRILMKDLRSVIDRVQHQLDPWQGRPVSKAGKSVLINSSMARLPMFAMGLYLFHESSHADIYKYQSRFFWQGRWINKSTIWSNGVTFVCQRTRGSRYKVY